MPISGAFFAAFLIEKQLEKLEMLTCFVSFFLLLLTDGEKAFSREEESSLNHLYHFTSRQGLHSTSLVWRLGEMQGIKEKEKKKKKKEKQTLPRRKLRYHFHKALLESRKSIKPAQTFSDFRPN